VRPRHRHRLDKRNDIGFGHATDPAPQDELALPAHEKKEHNLA